MVEFPREQGLVGEWRKWAEALYTSTERVTSSNVKGAKTMAILLHLHRPQDPCPQQPAFCRVPNRKRESVPFRIPPFHSPSPRLPCGHPSQEPGCPGSQGTSPSAGTPLSLLAQLSEERGLERVAGKDSGPRVWGVERIHIMHGGMSAWVEGIMHQ